ncbi:MAG: hypothetical protein ACE5ID_09120, partial [Acidobacteriota bacterium]
MVLGCLPWFSLDPLAAGGPELVLMDSCVDPAHPEFDVTLKLQGEGLLPSSLRTIIYFDPAMMTPLEREKQDAVEPGPFLGTVHPVFYFEADPSAGRVELVYNVQGRRPVPSIPVGPLARLHFKLQSLAPENG